MKVITKEVEIMKIRKLLIEKKWRKKAVVTYYRSNINDYKTINQPNNNNNIFIIKVNLIPKPFLNKSKLNKKLLKNKGNIII